MRILAGIGALAVLVAVGFFVFAIFYSDPIESSLDRCATIQSERGFEELNKWKLKMSKFALDVIYNNTTVNNFENEEQLVEVPSYLRPPKWIESCMKKEGYSVHSVADNTMTLKEITNLIGGNYPFF